MGKKIGRAPTYARQGVGAQKRIQHYDNTRRSKWQRKIKDHQSRSARRV